MNATGRRVLCLLPATAVVASGAPEVQVLVWSQVVLILTLPLVLVPVVVFGGRRRLMDDATSRRPVPWAAATATPGLCATGVASLIS